MGEKIKNLATGKVKNKVVEIELNHPSKKGEQRVIHIQSADGRIDFCESEFYQIALSICASAKRLKDIKNLDND